jgi:hypothetical protein
VTKLRILTWEDYLGGFNSSKRFILVKTGGRRIEKEDIFKRRSRRQTLKRRSRRIFPDKQ